MHLPRGLREREPVADAARPGAARGRVEAIAATLDRTPAPAVFDLRIADERAHSRVQRQLGAESHPQGRLHAQLESAFAGGDRV
ncbi:MAG: hypothetical protein DMF82_25455, partial [Acidobacteria bacterium]